MNNIIEESIYPIFDDRYSVVIGSRGKVSVISNVAHNKVMKVYGKKKDNLRFVNLTRFKGSGVSSYRLSDLKDLSQGIVDAVEPITENDILNILGTVKPPLLLENSDLIQSLPCEKDHYNSLSFIEELEGFNRFYKKIKFTNTSNGFLKFKYDVSTYCKETKVNTNSSTKVFTDYNTILIHNVSTLDDTTRLQIVNLLSGVNNEE